ncbi:MAG: hypothetical protein L0H64_15890 [Pseudonocardia sp.]|nr:hypothetical protein [Pseudonocardia sp.]
MCDGMRHLSKSSELPNTFLRDWNVIVRRSVAIVLVAIASLLGVATSASAQPEQPIDWTVSATIFGRGGEDLPLRIGQRDSPLSEGFGILHIQDGHGGFVPDPGLIQQAADTCPSNGVIETVCRIAGDGGRMFRVVWTERVVNIQA